MKRKLNVLNFGKLQGMLFGLLGVLAGVIYSFGGLFIDMFVSFGWVTSSDTPGLSIGTLLAFAALFIMPILFFAVGIVTGFIEAILYNLALKFMWLPYYRVYAKVEQ